MVLCWKFSFLTRAWDSQHSASLWSTGSVSKAVVALIAWFFSYKLVMKHFSLSHERPIRATGCYTLSLVIGLDLKTQPRSSDDLPQATRPDRKNISTLRWTEPRMMGPRARITAVLESARPACLVLSSVPWTRRGCESGPWVWGWGMRASAVPGMGPGWFLRQGEPGEQGVGEGSSQLAPRVTGTGKGHNLSSSLLQLFWQSLVMSMILCVT